MGSAPLPPQESWLVGLFRATDPLKPFTIELTILLSVLISITPRRNLTSPIICNTF